MSQKALKGSPELAETIKRRRHELNLTIEEAASKAGVGSKTWCRYEAGESIRKDKCKGICKALNWRGFPGESAVDEGGFCLKEYENHEAWSVSIRECYGTVAAISFVIGSDILLDGVREDLEALSSMPKGTHVGQLDVSWLAPSLPEQFLPRYDYDFLYCMRATIERLRKAAHTGNELVAHSVMEELCLYLIVQEAGFLVDSMAMDMEDVGIDYDEKWADWIFEVFDDDDIVIFLYSGLYLDGNDGYHFDHWYDEKFFTKNI